ncbi:hypothetical protein [Calothrix sp. PCC 7507]|uniref:hypothetical protein n=1 Tax=Calothrix sp. PCC 7507 TaxID=99598 RepID=UPI00029F2627|nr:hypothetical protein [Calothrix sp. PCC 7507]AFY35031.1 hypothetical protein Cal7507_4670 [Calothrix sp. PCC 7507]
MREIIPLTNLISSRMKHPYPLWALSVVEVWLVSVVEVWAVFLPGFLLVHNSAFSQNPPLPTEKGVKSACIDQNLETITTQLLQNLPNYANRATQRARRRSRSSDLYSYMLVAGRPEFTPLPLNPGGYSDNTTNSSTSGVEQVFFTTLERQYLNSKAVEVQQYHWLFLTKTSSGWRLVMMFSQIDVDAAKQLRSPPRDSSKSAIAQGISAWLRDCQAGSQR